MRAHLLRLSLIALAVGLPLGPAAPPVSAEEVTVVLKDGRVLEGELVAEAGDRITLRLRFGEVPIRRDDIERIERPGGEPAPSAEGGGPSGPPAPVPGPTGSETVRVAVITLKDGSTRRGVAEDGGDSWVVHVDFGVIHVAKKDVARIRYEEEVRRVEQEAADPDRRRVDVALGVEVVRPDAGWRFLDAPTEPWVRIEAVRTGEPRVVLRVGALPALEAAHREVLASSEDAVKESIQRDLQARYRSVRGLVLREGRFRGLPVWRASYRGDPRGLRTQHVVEEVRFHHGGVQVRLQALAPHDLREDVDPSRWALLRETLAAVGFSGPLDVDGPHLSSAALGVTVAAPAGWRVMVRLLDDAAPAELRAPGGGPAVRIERLEGASGGITPDAWTDRFEAERREASRFFERQARSHRGLGAGPPAVDLLYRDFEGGERLLSVRRLVFATPDRGLAQVVYRAAATGPGADRLLAGAAPAFEGVRAVEPLEPRLHARRIEEIEALVAAAEKAVERRDGAAARPPLDEALARLPTFAYARLLRGQALLDQKDYVGAIADLEAADAAMADPGVRLVLGRARNRYAHELERQGEDAFRDARKQFEAACAADPENRSYRNDLTNLLLGRSRDLVEAKRFDDAIDLMKDAERADPEEARFGREQLRAYHEWVRQLIRDEELTRARTVLKRAKKLDPEHSLTRSLEERIERAEEAKKKGR